MQLEYFHCVREFFQMQQLNSVNLMIFNSLKARNNYLQSVYYKWIVEFLKLKNFYRQNFSQGKVPNTKIFWFCIDWEKNFNFISF